jgi:hypothetical protein
MCFRMRAMRFRAGVLLLALALGLVGPPAFAGALAVQTSAPQMVGMASGSACAGCGTEDRHCMPATGCAVSVCPSLPALPTQIAAIEPPDAAVFGVFLPVDGSGIAARPDPHPPRSPFGS